MEDFNFGLPFIPNTEPFSVEDTDQLMQPIWKDMEFQGQLLVSNEEVYNGFWEPD